MTRTQLSTSATGFAAKNACSEVCVDCQLELGMFQDSAAFCARPATPVPWAESNVIAFFAVPPNGVAMWPLLRC